MEDEVIDLVFSELYPVAQNLSQRIKWPNKRLSGLENEQGYFKFDMLRPPKSSFGMKGMAIYRWICQVSIYVRDEESNEQALQYAQQFRSALPVTTRLVGKVATYVVMETADILQPVETPGWFFTPVQFPVRTIKRL